MANRNFFHFAGYFYNWKRSKIKDNWNKCCQACKDQIFSKKKSIQQALMRLKINMRGKQPKNVLFKTR